MVFGSKYLIKKNEKKRFKADIIVKKSGSFGEIDYRIILPNHIFKVFKLS